jgi:hypothetical protein
MNDSERIALYRRFVSTFHHGEKPIPVSPRDLDEAECVLGTMLPNSYRLFMTSFGEIYTPELFDLVPGLPEMPDLKNLASLQEVVSETPGCWSAGTPHDLIVIGNDIMGNLFCLPRKHLKGTLVQIQLCIAKEKILTAARQRGYRFKQKLTLPNGKSRTHLDAKIAERFMI